ncbi:CLEC-51 protein [Aphelenchoides avenae]|nr:CLEC-51 protein [Aphelenchus avenae]
MTPKFSFNSLLLCAAVVAVHKTHAVCPAGTIQGLSSTDCFILQPGTSSWLTAEESCVRAGGHLASVSSLLTNSFLLSKVFAQSCPASKYWLGGNYNLQETGRWTWSDGQRFSFSNWETLGVRTTLDSMAIWNGEPLTSGTYCLSVDAQTGQWYSESCGTVKPSLCRVPSVGAAASTTTTPRPSTINCPNGWTYIAQTKKCYQIPLDSYYSSWNQGLAKCQSLGGTLASIPNAAANMALLEFANKTAANAANHIGLHGGIGKWQWTDGTPVTYTNWKTDTGYPDGAGDCVEFHDIDEDHPDQWYDIGCDVTGYELMALCQRDPIS